MAMMSTAKFRILIAKNIIPTVETAISYQKALDKAKELNLVASNFVKR